MHGYDIFANVVVLAPPEKAKEIYDETAAFINRDTYVSAGITLTYARVFRKSLVTLPFILLIGVINPVFDHRVAMTVCGVDVWAGWISFISIVVRGLLSVQAALLLVYVCGFNGVCRALGRLGLPSVMVTQLLMVSRYMQTLGEEAVTMHRARQSRGYGRRNYPIREWGPLFSIDKGEKVALLGLNGAGKSTLLLQTNGLLSPASGRVDVDGVALTKKTVTLARQKVGLVFQNADDQLFSPTVYADVAFGPQMMKLPADEVDRRVREALEGIGASRLIDRQATRLSGGERRMVAIATVLSMRPSILVLDEPTSYLDLRARNALCSLLRRLPQAMLLATHNLDLARDICSRSILLDRGCVVFDGPTDEAVDRLVSLAGENG